MIEIDGSEGEGGGQVLRSALTLSMATGQPFRIVDVRGRRPRPGLMRQHLTALNAAVEVCGGKCMGAEAGSREVAFWPGAVQPADYHFAVGTAGSATLVLQTVLPALAEAARAGRGPSTVIVEGGTHNPMAPPFDFLEEAFIPLFNRIYAGAARATVGIERMGFAPSGGGRITCKVEPDPGPSPPAPIRLMERGGRRSLKARSLVAGGLSTTIAKRELARVVSRLKLGAGDATIVSLAPRDTTGPGNFLAVIARFDAVTEVFSAVGRKGTSSEEVANAVCEEARAMLLAEGAAVGIHLADQLLVPMAAGGVFSTLEPTPHSRTNAGVVQRFLAVPVALEETNGAWVVAVGTS